MNAFEYAILMAGALLIFCLLFIFPLALMGAFKPRPKEQPTDDSVHHHPHR